MVHVIAANRKWYEKMPARLEALTKEKFVFIDKKELLTLSELEKIKPRYIFFPHWSYRIPEEIFTKYECVIFHMTDLPFGRGGSPLQNLIARGIYETKISAIRCEKDIDAGPIYLKRDLSLYGSAEEIYMRAAQVIEEMIVSILAQSPEPVPQIGQPVYFQRRKPEDGNIGALYDLRQLYDYIRMLDAQDYPPAYLETEYFRFEFKRAVLKYGKIISDVVITKKDEKL